MLTPVYPPKMHPVMPGRAFAHEVGFRLQLDAWFDARVNSGITARCAAARSTA